MLSNARLPLRVDHDFSFDSPSGMSHFILDAGNRALAEVFDSEFDDQEALANLICELLNRHCQGVQP